MRRKRSWNLAQRICPREQDRGFRRLSLSFVRRIHVAKMVLALFDQMMAKLKANDKAHVAFCVSGILGCLVCYGVLQVRG